MRLYDAVVHPAAYLRLLFRLSAFRAVQIMPRACKAYTALLSRDQSRPYALQL
jgi:hypothetical protein